MNESQTVNAISLAITPNIALGATRRGSLSMWKGCASGNAARNGVFAALLARAGMTGPERPAEGPLGLSELVGDRGLSLADAGQFRMLQADMKYFVTEYHSIAPIMMAIRLAEGHAVDDIEAIAIATYKFAYEEIGSGPEKWRPTTRETADHSMPYIVAAALVNGGFSDAIFEPARFADEQILRLADKIIIREDPELTRQLPHRFPCRMDMRISGGRMRSAAMNYPRGHHDDPMSDEEVNDKFRQLASRKLSPTRAERALDRIWCLEGSPSASDIFELFRIDSRECRFAPSAHGLGRSRLESEACDLRRRTEIGSFEGVRVCKSALGAPAIDDVDLERRLVERERINGNAARRERSEPQTQALPLHIARRHRFDGFFLKPLLCAEIERHQIPDLQQLVVYCHLVLVERRADRFLLRLIARDECNRFRR